MIKFSFINLKDISKIYKEKYSSNDFLGEETRVATEEYIAISYYDSILKDLINTGIITKYEYKGCLERIANELYEVVIRDNLYNIFFTFDSFEHCNQLTITIDYKEIYNLENNLEKLKFGLKSLLIKDWNRCIWLIDEQSEALASQLYNKMYSVENLIRELVNNVLIKVLGVDWIHLPEFHKVNKQYKLRSLDFKRTVDSFKNVDDSLISITTDTLFEIMKTVIYNQSVDLNELIQEKSDIKLKLFDNEKNASLLQILRELYNKKYNLWEDFFKNLFPSDVETIVTDFIKNRNHIAHNKLVDFYASQKIEDNITRMREIIGRAITKTNDIEMSKEYLETLETIDEQERDEKEIILSLKKSDTGIEIRTEKEIFEYLGDILENFYSIIHDKFYFSAEVFLTEFINIKVQDKEVEVFKICNNVNKEDTLCVYGKINITEGEGETSKLLISIRCKDNIFMQAEIQYTNGEVIYDAEQSCYMPERDSMINIEVIDNLSANLIAYVENEMNTLKKEIDDSRYSILKDGGNLPVADLVCWNCGCEYISIDDELYPYGKCINCGEDNNLKECGRCGELYNESEDGDDFFCGYCKQKIDED